MPLLDPTNDYVFKVLFKDPGDEPRLIAMLTAILEPTHPISSVTVLNPELPTDLAKAKTIVLDLLLRLADGSKIDVEIESSPARPFANRLVFYWSRIHSQQLAKGEGYDELRPTISIAWTARSLVRSDSPATSPTRMHSRFRIRNVDTNADLTDHLELHVLELPKRTADATLSPELRRWARFFDHPSDADLSELAAEDALMADAVNKLRAISEDEMHAIRADERARSEETYRFEKADAFREGREEGRAEGIQETRLASARALLHEGVDRAVIARIAGVPESELDDYLAGR